MSSIPIQDIVFKFSNGARIEGLVEAYGADIIGQVKGNIFGAECIFPAVPPGNMRVMSRMEAPVSTANKAFEWIAEECWKYAQEFGLDILSIDNPYNAPFVHQHDQAAIMSIYEHKGQVLVNGQP